MHDHVSLIRACTHKCVCVCTYVRTYVCMHAGAPVSCNEHCADIVAHRHGLHTRYMRRQCYTFPLAERLCMYVWYACMSARMHACMHMFTKVSSEFIEMLLMQHAAAFHGCA